MDRKQVYIVTRYWESGFGPTEQLTEGVYSNSELAYAAILRQIIAEHQNALENLEPDGSDPDYLCSRCHNEDRVRWEMAMWDINSGTCEHKGTFR